MGKTHKRVPHRATAAGKTRSDTEVGKGEFRVSMEEKERGRKRGKEIAEGSRRWEVGREGGGEQSGGQTSVAGNHYIALLMGTVAVVLTKNE